MTRRVLAPLDPVETQNTWFPLLLSRAYHFPPGMTLSLIALGLWAAAVCVGDFTLEWFDLTLPLTIHSLLGFVVSLLLVFRTNSAYERWWEARKLLGALNDNSRYFVIKIYAYARLGLDDRARLAQWVCAYVWSIKEHMRDKVHNYSAELVPCDYRAAYLQAGHKPIYLMSRLADFCKNLVDTQKITPFELITIENGLKTMGDLVGGCERIKNTPIPLAYTLHLRRIILLYVMTLPLGLVHDYQWWTIPVTLITFYIMAGIEYIGEEIEEPFGRDENDLPVSTISARICSGIASALEVENPCEATDVAATTSVNVRELLRS